MKSRMWRSKASPGSTKVWQMHTLVGGCLLLLSAFALAQAGIGDYGSHYEGRVGGRPKVVVFVHGIYGDAQGTWTAPNKAFFPALVAQDTSIAQSNVFVAGYQTRFIGQNHSAAEPQPKHFGKR